MDSFGNDLFGCFVGFGAVVGIGRVVVRENAAFFLALVVVGEIIVSKGDIFRGLPLFFLFFLFYFCLLEVVLFKVALCLFLSVIVKLVFLLVVLFLKYFYILKNKNKNYIHYF